MTGNAESLFVAVIVCSKFHHGDDMVYFQIGFREGFTTLVTGKVISA